MDKILKILLSTFLFCLFVLLLNQCKTDEFKIGEIKIKEDFKTELIVPVFSGSLEFSDFLNWEENRIAVFNDSVSILKFSDGSTVNIPNQIIFEPTTLVPNFPFSIQGNYDLLTIELKFIINNGTPFPLNIKLRLFNKTTPSKLGPPIVPPSFQEGLSSGSEIIPVESVKSVLLNEEQRLSFMNGNRIRITTWFDRTNFIDENDTLNANYPVDISVILLGEAIVKDED